MRCQFVKLYGILGNNTLSFRPSCFSLYHLSSFTGELKMIITARNLPAQKHRERQMARLTI